MFNIEQILKEINYIDYTGNKELSVNKVLPLNDIHNAIDAICWCSDKNSEKLKEIVTSSIIIISSNVDREFVKSLNCIVVENPRLVFQQVLTEFFAPKRVSEIHFSAKISEESNVGNNAFIGNNVVIERGCRIGDNVIILHNTVILENTIIGNNVTIGSNNTIGGVGFGYEKNKDNDFVLIPHIGNVIISDNVDIGSNTCVDRAVLGSTIIGENVKIDNLVHIAHGVQIGRNAVVIANAMVAGSVSIGENSWIAPSASIINQKNVGDNSLVGLGAVVTKDVGSNAIVAGNPAKFIRNIK
tara:strand:+ start:20226 stop:21122 length:897 start_codon:yes stop_codon:yes gene_type:complete